MGFPNELDQVDWEKRAKRGYTKKQAVFPGHSCSQCGESDEFIVFEDGTGKQQAKYCNNCGTQQR